MMFYLIGSHFICDYALQSAYMSEAKCPVCPCGCDQKWIWPMLAHSFTHGVGVAIATGSVILGLSEVAAHFCIDLAKCNKVTNIHVDQFLHLLCKLAWFGWYCIGVW